MLQTERIKQRKRHILFSQNSLMSETASESPEVQHEQHENVHKQHATSDKENNVPKSRKKARTVIHRDNSLVIAQPPKSGFKRPLQPIVPISSTTNDNIAKKVKPKAAKKLNMHPMTRRSSMDFVSLEALKAKRRKVSILISDLKYINAKNIVCTSCHSEDVDLANQLATQLSGKVRVQEAVGPRTTHVVCGDGRRRTLNMLRGILRGCWIVSKSWLFASLEAEGWLDEEPYELVSFSAAVKARRLEREAFFDGSSTKDEYKSDMLKHVGSLYLDKECKAPRKELADLVSLAGGRVANQLRVADVVVGAKMVQGQIHESQEVDGEKDVVFVSEQWLRDSLQHHSHLPFIDYQMSSKS